MRKTTKELFGEIKERIIVDLEENEVICEHCNGLKMKYVESNGKGHVEYCNKCHNGKMRVCKHCGKLNSTSYCGCRGEWSEKEYIRFSKAKKISYYDYDGKILMSERACDVSDIEDYLYDLIKNDENYPEYWWATEKDNFSLSVDLYDQINNNEFVDSDWFDLDNEWDDRLTQAQDLIDRWAHDKAFDTYTETWKIAIDLKPLIKKIKEES